MYGGLFVPASRLGEFPLDEARPGHVREWRHEDGAALGARLTIWLTQLLGVEAAFTYSSSNLKWKEVGLPARGPSDIFRQLEANVLAATARTLLRFAGAPGVEFHVLGGFGLVSRYGEAYDDVEGTMDPAIVLGGGLRVRVGPKVFFRFDMEDHISDASLEYVGRVTSVPLGAHLQNDLLFSQALVLKF